ncbi:hypothetical protein Tco_0678384 [Tanacetum coccineum]|uniref:Uncharacterized protein n=1 Tax=Tanacetum coccineum TaxID=301880 RepID=A0ABQ4XG29_9ASTR
MVLQLTDFTSEITDEELREFTSEYYIPFALHPVVPAASASIADFPEGKVGVYTRFFEFANQRVPLSLFMCNVQIIHVFIFPIALLAQPKIPISRFDYTEKLDALRRWREMFFWVDDALVPWDFAFYTQGSLPRDERPPPGSYSMEDAELINENQMDLFSVVHLSKPKLVTEGVRPLRDGEEPLLESTAGRTMELVLEQPEVESTDVLAPTPLRSVPGATEEPPRLDATSVGSSEDADVAGAESEAGEVDSGLKRKRATSDDGAGTSKRVRHVSLGLSTSTEEETPDAPPTLAAKEVTETPPPNVEATRGTGDRFQRRVEGMPVDSFMEELDMGSLRRSRAVGLVRARCSSDAARAVAHKQRLRLADEPLWNLRRSSSSLGDVVKCDGMWKGGSGGGMHEKKLLTVRRTGTGYNDMHMRSLLMRWSVILLELLILHSWERDRIYPIGG